MSGRCRKDITHPINLINLISFNINGFKKKFNQNFSELFSKNRGIIQNQMSNKFLKNK